MTNDFFDALDNEKEYLSDLAFMEDDVNNRMKLECFVCRTETEQQIAWDNEEGGYIACCRVCDCARLLVDVETEQFLDRRRDGETLQEWVTRMTDAAVKQ